MAFAACQRFAFFADEAPPTARWSSRDLEQFVEDRHGWPCGSIAAPLTRSMPGSGLCIATTGMAEYSVVGRGVSMLSSRLNSRVEGSVYLIDPFG